MTLISQAVARTSKFPLSSAVVKALQQTAKYLKKSKNTDEFISRPRLCIDSKNQQLIYGNKNILKLTYAGKNILGSGGQGQQQAGVVTHIYKDRPAAYYPVAVKFFNNKNNYCYTQEFQALLANAKSSPPHPNLQKLIPNDQNLIATQLEVTDLSNYLEPAEQGKNPISLAQKLKLILQTASGLKHLHSLGFLHLDIKPANILINASGDAVLCDLGGNTNKTARKHDYFGFGVPEGTSNVSQKSDVFILSAMITQLLSEHKIQVYDTCQQVYCYMDTDEQERITWVLYDSLLKQTEQTHPSGCLAFARSLGEALHRDPKQRPTLDQLITALQVFSESLTPAPTIQQPLPAVPDPAKFRIPRPHLFSAAGQYAPNAKDRKVTFADNA